MAVINRIANHYTIDRVRRLTDLATMVPHLSVASLEQFAAFTEYYGKVADDLSFFVSDDGALATNWSTPIEDITLGGRRKNWRTFWITFRGDYIETSGPDTSDVTRIHGENGWRHVMDDVIDLYRTHRLTS